MTTNNLSPFDNFNKAMSALRLEVDASIVDDLQKIVIDYVDYSVGAAMNSQGMAIYPIMKERDDLEKQVKELKLTIANLEDLLKGK